MRWQRFCSGGGAYRLAERVVDAGGAAPQLDAAVIGRAAAAVVRDPDGWHAWGDRDAVLVRLKDLWHLLVAHGGSPSPRLDGINHLASAVVDVEVDLSDGADAAAALAVAQERLRAVARGEAGAILRISRPPATVAFGRLDALRPGYEAARAAASAHHFEPLLRAPGGHAVAYHGGSLVVDHIAPAADTIQGVQARFADMGSRLVGALRALGVDARVGEVPGEFCPGEHGVNARGAVKLVGTAQRVIRGAWLLSASIVVTDAASIRAVLTDVYAALELGWDPATAVGVADEAPGVTVEQVAAAVAAAYR